MKWLKQLSVRSKFSIIIGLLMLILLFGLVNFWFSLKIMSATRAYVGGEGLWSKSQKDAVNYLIKYTTSFDEADYNNYLAFLKVPLGDKQARLEMNKANPDHDIIRQGFIQGGNSTEDVPDLIFLYRWFRNVSYMDIAIQDWTKGDAEIEALMRVGDRIHANVVTSRNNSDLDREATSELVSLIDEVYMTDKRLTLLENHFSATLAEGSRRIRDILFIVTVILTLMLGSFALFVAVYIGKIIEDVERVKDEFISAASHELRTPMAAIKGYLSMIHTGQYGAVSETLRAPLNIVAMSTDRLIALVNDILSVSRIETGSLKLTVTVFALRDVVEDVIANLKPIVSQKHLMLKNTVDKEIIVQADPQKLGQLLTNLIGNASKFTDAGEIILSSTEDEEKVTIFVSDTGNGIALDSQKKLFSKFQQVTSQQAGRPAGTGLGLYISREYARLMGGDLWLVSSGIGKGSTFAFTLPKAGSHLALTVRQKLTRKSPDALFLDSQEKKNE